MHWTPNLHFTFSLSGWENWHCLLWQVPFLIHSLQQCFFAAGGFSASVHVISRFLMGLLPCFGSSTPHAYIVLVPPHIFIMLSMFLSLSFSGMMIVFGGVTFILIHGTISKNISNYTLPCHWSGKLKFHWLMANVQVPVCSYAAVHSS